MSSKHRSLRLTLSALAALAPTLAFAHPGVAGHTHGFIQGFAHPISGIDHILAMVAVGIFAANLGGRALLAVPLTFMGFMLVGGTLGILGFPLPFVEVGIALSIVVLGLAVAAKWDWPLTAAMAMVGLFAVFHGHAHGTEMPLDASGAAYAAGFVAATGLLHLAGIGIGLAIGRTGQLTSHRITQAGGVAVALAGIAVLVGIV
jgi:urease accessory protein